MAKITRKDFIEIISPMAMNDMKWTQIPASLTIAQAILESADGNSALTIQANNLFGIKGTGTKGSVSFKTNEYINGQIVPVQANFRAYNTWEESITDHSELFHKGVSWNKNLYKKAIGADGITAAKEIAKAGYATDPKYADKLISIIYAYDLLQYDKPKSNIPKPVPSTLSELEEKVNLIISQLTPISLKLTEIPAPEWFINEFPDALNLISRKTGTEDFWRAFAVALRITRK